MNTKEKFLLQLNKFNSKGLNKIELESVQDLLSLTEEADKNFRSFDDILVDWTERYIEIQNEVNSINNMYKIWQDSTDNLDEAKQKFLDKSSDIGINADDIPAYRSAEITVNAYRTNDEEYNEILNVASNMTNL
mgnify:FL=1|tara:strand:+ start:194 stop:595 length:402 start_codon:yes stop_codon:yes gene_type:complete